VSNSQNLGAKSPLKFTYIKRVLGVFIGFEHCQIPGIFCWLWFRTLQCRPT
ncbi:hypothetical protein S245_010458, partial [Arachis hypogaea]